MTDATTLGQSGAWSNGNEGDTPYFPQIQNSPPNICSYHTQDNPF